MAMRIRPSSAAACGTPRPLNSMTLPLKNLPDCLEKRDPYLMPPNAYEHSDFYMCMDPAGPAFAPQGPPQYKAFHSANFTTKDQLYSEIPGEYLATANYKEEDQPQDEYVSSTEFLHCSNKEEEKEKEKALQSDTSMREMYGNS